MGEKKQAPLARALSGKRVSTSRRKLSERVGTEPANEGVSIYDVAERAGVSIVTVSRVFNDYPHVSKSMRERVLTSARLVGYQPRMVSKRNLLAVLVGGLDHLAAGDQASRLILALVRSAAARGYLIEFIPAHTTQLATQHLVNGLITVGLSSDEMESLRDLPSVPKVAVNNPGVDEHWSVVCMDPVSEVDLAVNHLVEQGHRKITLLHDTSRGWYAEQREAAFHEALDKAGLDGHRVLLSSFCQHPIDLARQITRHGTAGLCMCNNGGLPLLDGLQNELGLRVPEDFSLITIEKARVSAFVKPRLTTLDQPLEELAEVTVDGLLKQVEGVSTERFVTTLKSRLIPRDSVRRYD
jgi:LacI family transcriptional regulator